MKAQIKYNVSVVIPVYKDYDGLESTLKSLSTQKTKYLFETIVIRDTDKKGSYWARNEGIKKSKGKYIAFIDAGTIAPHNWINNGATALENYDYVGGKIEIIKPEKGFFSNLFYTFLNNREFAVDEFMADKHFSPTTNLFVKKDVFDKLGMFDSRLISSGDYEFGDSVYRSSLFKQKYDKNVNVYHPMRSFKEYMSKQKRLATGFSDLRRYYPERFGKPSLLIFFKIFLPPVWLVGKNSWIKLNLLDKLSVFFLTYFFATVQNYYILMNYLTRMK